jgi:uncharacterized membrane protein YcaP (DUF421 family)
VMGHLILLVRAFGLYLLCLLVIRIMGKRTIAQLSPFDLIVMIIIGDAIAIPMQDENVPILHGIIPVLTVSVLNYLMSIIITKSRLFENFLQGVSTALVKDGEVMVKNLRKERISMADLMILLREKDVDNINEVAEATLEPNGKLSIIKKRQYHAVTCDDLGIPPEAGNYQTVIIDNGEVVVDNLERLRVSMSHIIKELNKKGVLNIDKVSRVTIDENGNLNVVKGRSE